MVIEQNNNNNNLTKYYITNIFMSKYECVSVHIIIIIIITTRK